MITQKSNSKEEFQDYNYNLYESWIMAFPSGIETWIYVLGDEPSLYLAVFLWLKEGKEI